MARSMAITASAPLWTDWRPCFTGDTVRNTFAGLGASIGLMFTDLVDGGFTAEPGAICSHGACAG